MSETIQISTGEKRIAIVRDGKPAGEIAFNPSDVVFAEKFYRLIGEFETKSAEFTRRAEEIKDDTQAQLKLLGETCAFFKDRIDYLFGPGTSAVAFGDANALNMFSQFFDGLTPFIRGARAAKLKQYIVDDAKERKARALATLDKPRKPRKRK